MNPFFEPGCIKDRLCQAIACAGPIQYADLRAKEICNPTLLDVALSAVVRDGYVRREGTAYVLTPKASAAYGDGSETHDDEAATHESSAEEATMATKKTCADCKKPKPADIEHFTRANRSPDGLAKACRVCTETPYVGASSKAPTAKVPVVQATVGTVADSEVYVIPSAGPIQCRSIGEGPLSLSSFRQGDQEIVATLVQLQLLRDWADSQLKREFAR